jgi:hypothetical protein
MLAVAGDVAHGPGNGTELPLVDAQENDTLSNGQ